MKKVERKQTKHRKTLTLTKEVAGRIRNLIISGKEREEICEELDINIFTWDKWYYRNTSSFRVDLTNWRQEFMLKTAIRNHRDFLVMPTEIMKISDSDDEEGARPIIMTDPRLLKLKSDHTIYITDTLGKDTYSKRIIQEDPEAAKKSEVNELRQGYKKLMNDIRKMNHGSTNHKDKLKNALK